MKPKAGDFAIAVLVFALAVAIWVFPFFRGKGNYAVIESDSSSKIKLSLDEDRELSVSGCTVRVENGSVYVYKSDCPDNVCVKTGKISRAGEAIICVPNKVSIKISGESRVDAIAG